MAKAKRKPQGGENYSLEDAIKETMSLYKAFTAPIDLNEVDIHSHVRYRKSNCLALDWVIANHNSNGGWPMGKMIEVYGPAGCGKTTIATVIAIATQKYKERNKVLIVDFEHKYNLPYAFSLGLDPSKTIFVQPSGESSGEQGMNLIINASKANDVGLIICDSINALITKQEEEGDLGDANIGSKARLQTQTIRKIANKQHSNSPSIIWINQLVDNIGVMFGSTEKTPGAKAIRFFSAVRIDIRARGKIEVGEDVVGQDVDIKAVKNQCGRPFIESEIRLIFGEGYDNQTWLIEKAEKLEVIEKRAGKYYSSFLSEPMKETQLTKHLEDKKNLYFLYDLCVKKNEERIKLSKCLDVAALKEEPEESSEQNSVEEASPF